MNSVVLDASAILALLNNEAGSQGVAKALPGAVVSAVNLSEVVAKLTHASMPADAVREALAGLGLEVHVFDLQAAYSAGLLRSSTHHLGLSLGDRACIALGMQLGVPVLTADQRWKSLKLAVKIRVIR